MGVTEPSRKRVSGSPTDRIPFPARQRTRLVRNECRRFADRELSCDRKSLVVGADRMEADYGRKVDACVLSGRAQSFPEFGFKADPEQNISWPSRQSIASACVSKQKTQTNGTGKRCKFSMLDAYTFLTDHRCNLHLDHRQKAQAIQKNQQYS